MKKIMLGYDDTEPSRRALERAAQLTKAFGSELIVISVTPVFVGAGRSAGPVDPMEPVEKHSDELAHARSYLEGQGIEASYQPAVGDVSETIVELANQRGADLIIVGTREPSRLERVFGQSVSDAIAHHAHTDIMIVH
ncbi:MAG TPA: universal stress protein [Solirubrobacteraceae bacterium]|nr:universal stress protein [Solirubrobacteraceae bacterium]